MFFFWALVCVCVMGLEAPMRTMRKQLAGPPSEFKNMAVPNPAAAAMRADTGFMPVKLSAERSGKVYDWEAVAPVDSSSEFALSILSPFTSKLQIFLMPPGASEWTELKDSLFTGKDALGKKTEGPYGIDGSSYPGVTYTFPDPQVGDWRVRVESQTKLAQRDGIADAILVLQNESPMKLLSHVTTYDLQLDQQVGVVVQMYDADAFPDELDITDDESKPQAVGGVVESATLHVVYPDQTTAQLPMHDDGMHGDGLAADGVYGAKLTATQTGDYITRADVTGSFQGRRFLRTSEHYIPVARPAFTLTGLSTAKLVGDVMQLHLDVDSVDGALEAGADNTVRLYAEVWGSRVASDAAAAAAAGYDEYVPVAWVQAMVDASKVGDRMTMQLDLAQEWLVKAGAVAPLQLRNVVMQDRNSNVLLSTRSVVYVQEVNGADELRRRVPRAMPDLEITERMREGPRPARYNRSTAPGAGNGKLVLVHGYCSGPVWPVEDFADAVVFEDFKQSRSQDEFALRILDFTSDLGSCGIVGHSQGGLASLHLKSYYWSCLDTAKSGRLIQTVGSPYGGCSMAGSLADVGAVFGTGCGSQPDLTVDGASLWLSKIPMEPRKTVYFHTTQYEDNWWLFSDCVSLSNLILYKPNDGTCEKKFAILEGANNEGHTVGECHTTDMKFPPQCEDAARNKKMSDLASR